MQINEITSFKKINESFPLNCAYLEMRYVAICEYRCRYDLRREVFVNLCGGPVCSDLTV